MAARPPAALAGASGAALLQGCAGKPGDAMRGRYAPPSIVYALPRADDPSQAIDAAFFERNPGTKQYTRKYIPGETPEPMPPDTWVHVMLVGVERVRGFAPPDGRLN
jgi:hypothetical protein